MFHTSAVTLAIFKTSSDSYLQNNANTASIGFLKLPWSKQILWKPKNIKKIMKIFFFSNNEFISKAYLTKIEQYGNQQNSKSDSYILLSLSNSGRIPIFSEIFSGVEFGTPEIQQILISK